VSTKLVAVQHIFAQPIPGEYRTFLKVLRDIVVAKFPDTANSAQQRIGTALFLRLFSARVTSLVATAKAPSASHAGCARSFLVNAAKFLMQVGSQIQPDSKVGSTSTSLDFCHDLYEASTQPHRDWVDKLFA